MSPDQIARRHVDRLLLQLADDACRGVRHEPEHVRMLLTAMALEVCLEIGAAHAAGILTPPLAIAPGSEKTQ